MNLLLLQRLDRVGPGSAARLPEDRQDGNSKGKYSCNEINQPDIFWIYTVLLEYASH